ncbi:MAG: glycoside hydrolase family 2 TIM barrel-domain containing protein [Oscillospiraceae bacterium]
MRKVISINEKWSFSKDNIKFENVNLPHTWNNLDGQDGGADYLRQKCYYNKKLDLIKTDKRVFIEFEGVNHIANVYFNGNHLGEHRGGFSTFRYDLTDLIGGENLLIVETDNSEEIPVYPQQADFTFFGGIYRDVNIVEVSETHFTLEKSGSAGIFIKPTVLENGNANIDVSLYVKGNLDGVNVRCSVLDKKGEVVSCAEEPAVNKTVVLMQVFNPNLWQGLENPYLYTLKAELVKDDIVIDNKDIDFGVREFKVDNEKGFILNGKEVPLRGVSRHQDRQDIGWALNKKDHEDDMSLIKEVGANTIRLAHYQHNQYFYDLCDKEGMVIWAEIPFITMFIEGEEAKQNTLDQMTELIAQNFNHPSICFWGISNEITIGGETPELEQNQKELVDLINKCDKSRLTTLANVSFVDMESNQNKLTDIVGYNHYFGWYGGELEQNEEWIDDFHKKYQDRPLCISEYGAEGIITLHTDNPECRDYTEEYHSVYHEHMLKIFETRPFIWATYQWNMFDFAADARDEGGVKGRNNKGLVSFDRQIKKDAFFIYKAYWSHEKFVHITGRRYFDRACEKTTIKIYSNCDEVTLCVNGKEIETLKSNKIFVFNNVALQMGENIVTAVCGNFKDEIKLNRCEQPNESYVLVEEETQSGDGAKNWFEDLSANNTATVLEFKEGYYSIKDTIGDVMKSEAAMSVFENIMSAGMGGLKPNPGMLKMLQGMKIEVILKMAGKKVPENMHIMINAELQKHKK